MIARAISGAMIGAAIIHLLPSSGVASADRIAAWYGIPVESPDLEILMRHRAVLLGIVGGLLLYAAIKPALQPVAFSVGMVSASAFLWLALSVGGYNASVRTVVTADIVALASLLAGAGMYLLKVRRHRSGR